jgi:hypothetical protein
LFKAEFEKSATPDFSNFGDRTLLQRAEGQRRIVSTEPE